MSRFLHQIGSVLGPIVALVPQVVPFLPGHVANVVMSTAGVVATLFASLGKAFGGQGQGS